VSNPASSLPVGAAIDTVLRDVTYTNALPEWLSPKRVDYSSQRAAVEKKIDAYSNGGSPAKPFAVLIPRKTPGSKAATWLQISITDQMVLQTCTGSLAPKIDEKFDRKRVFSYRYNTDKNSLQLTEDQCDAWEAFKKETKRQATSSGNILLLDLEQSYARINRADFLKYLRQFSTSQIETEVLQALLTTFEPSGTGVPLINNSMFFLGNAYLSQADAIIARHTTDYIRFGDDYSIAGKSGPELENLYKQINKDFQQDGRFRLNELKTNIFAAEQYCVRLEGKPPDDQGDAYNPVPQSVDPNVLTTSLGDTVKNPDKLLNDGVGRFQLSSLRRLRDLYPAWSHDSVSNDLIHSSDVLRTTIRLLKTYAPSTDQMWRSIWLIYLMKGIDDTSIHDKALQKDFREVVTGVQSAAGVPQVVQLWAKSHLGAGSSQLFAQLSDASYEDAGKLCCGG